MFFSWVVQFDSQHRVKASPRGSSPGPSSRAGRSKSGTSGGVSTTASKTCASVLQKWGFFQTSWSQGHPDSIFRAAMGSQLLISSMGAVCAPGCCSPPARVAEGLGVPPRQHPRGAISQGAVLESRSSLQAAHVKAAMKTNSLSR